MVRIHPQQIHRIIGQGGRHLFPMERLCILESSCSKPLPGFPVPEFSAASPPRSISSRTALTQRSWSSRQVRYGFSSSPVRSTQNAPESLRESR